METEPKKTISRRKFVADSIGFGLLGVGLSILAWGGINSEVIEQAIKKEVPIPKNINLKAQLSGKKYVTEKFVVGILGILTGGTQLVYREWKKL